MSTTATVTNYATKALEKKVEAVDACNRYAAELLPEVTAFLKPYLGKKIVKKDGRFIAAFEKSETLYKGGSLKRHYCRPSYSGGISVEVMVDVPLGGDSYRTETHKVYLYVGTTRDGILSEMIDNTERKFETYTVEQVSKAQEEIDRLKCQIHALEKTIYPFAR
jgi:hypothetical protein